MDYRILTKRLITSFFLLSFLYFLIFFLKDYINIFISLIYLLILIEIIFYINNFKNYIIFYISISFILFQIYFYYFFNFEYFIFIIFLVIIFDSFSYFLGSFFGKKKLFPSISPGKTYLGLFAGCFFSLIFSIIIHSIFFFELNFYLFNISSIFLIIFSLIGDLIESYFKRSSNLKNSSNFLPGHGGFFDRFDGFIFISYLLPFVGFFL